MTFVSTHVRRHSDSMRPLFCDLMTRSIDLLGNISSRGRYLPTLLRPAQRPCVQPDPTSQVEHGTLSDTGDTGRVTRSFGRMCEDWRRCTVITVLHRAVLITEDVPKR